MAIKLRTRSKHFGAVLDTRIWTDPWDLGLKLEILRDGADAWRKFLSDNGLSDSPLLKNFIQEQWMLNDRNQRGGRMKSKLSDAQIKEQAAKRALASTDLNAQNLESLGKLKPGLVEIGIVRVIECPSAHVRCTKCSHRWEMNGAGHEPCPNCQDLASVDDPENAAAPTGDAAKDAAIQAELKARLLENITDADGHILLIDRVDDDGEEVPQGGNPVGDGIALAILIAMREQEAFRVDFQAEAQDVLPPGSAGPSAAGSS